jgi:hypothetical protein
MIRFCSFAILLPLVVGGTSAAFAAEPDKTRVNAVVELFTSQGCSSCPPADAVMESYAKRPGVLALTFSVDYWDYLGWKDTLSDPKFTKRQRAYAKARGDGQVYTPQVVVNGVRHVVGSQADAIDGALAATKEQSTSWVPMTISMAGDHLAIEAPAGPKADATIWLVMLSRRTDVQVKRGENAGRLLTYFNVVRDISPIGMWTGQALSVRLDRRTLNASNAEQCAVILQKGHAGPIIGAALLPRW